MELILLAARLLLAAIFLLAGVTKLADRKGQSRTLVDFGLPAALARPLSRLLPVGELLVAVALIPVDLAWYGACGALALLSLFLIGIGVNMARGRKPDCRCFGQLHSAPIGWPILARNGALAALAGWLVFRGRLRAGPSLWAHLAAAGGNERRLFIVAACFTCWLFFRALRSGESTEPGTASMESQPADESETAEEPEPPAPRRTTSPGSRATVAPARNPPPENPGPASIAPSGMGLPIGTPAPEFELLGITGQKYSLQSLRAPGKSIVLVFSSPHCEPCRTLLPNINRWMREHGELLNIVVVSRGTVKDNLAKSKDVEPSRVLLQREFEVADAYQCSLTPTAVVIGADGLIRSDLAVGGLAIGKLIASSASVPSLESQSGPPAR